MKEGLWFIFAKETEYLGLGAEVILTQLSKMVKAFVAADLRGRKASCL